MESRQAIDSSAQPVTTESQRSVHSNAHVVAGHGGRANAELNRPHASDDSVEPDLAVHLSRGIVARSRTLNLCIGGNGHQLAKREGGAGEQERPPRRARTHCDACRARTRSRSRTSASV